MSTSIIADSSGLVSLISETDSNHQSAGQIANDSTAINGSIIVPSDVFSETLNVLGRKISHAIAAQAGQEIMNTETFLIIEASEATRETAFELFRNQPESVSFTDCIVMAFADHFRTKAIFGFDDVFRKNGYIRLGLDS